MAHAPDDTQLEFRSDWDIDRLIATGQVAVNSGTTALYTFTGNAPVFEVQFRNTGNTHWNVSGPDALPWHSFIQGSTIYISVDRSGDARYFIWSDKVTY